MCLALNPETFIRIGGVKARQADHVVTVGYQSPANIHRGGTLILRSIIHDAPLYT